MFGNRSEDGEVAVARLLTVTANVPDATTQCTYLTLTAAIRSHRRPQAVASLLPKRS
jgi:hypothetical protein